MDTLLDKYLAVQLKLLLSAQGFTSSGFWCYKWLETVSPTFFCSDYISSDSLLQIYSDSLIPPGLSQPHYSCDKVTGADRGCYRQYLPLWLRHSTFQQPPRSGSPFCKEEYILGLFLMEADCSCQSTQSRSSHTGSQTADWHSASGHMLLVNLTLLSCARLLVGWSQSQLILGDRSPVHHQARIERQSTIHSNIHMYG